MAVVGGAVLARYMLPVVPLVIILFVSTLRRRVRLWRGVIAIVALAFVAALFVNPPYGFSIEDNLAYRDYILLHQQAEDYLEARYPMARVLTAWPASDELTRPYLGYVTRPDARLPHRRLHRRATDVCIRPAFKFRCSAGFLHQVRAVASLVRALAPMAAMENTILRLPPRRPAQPPQPKSLEAASSTAKPATASG